MDQRTIEAVFKTLGIEKENFGAGSGSSKGWIKTKGKALVSYSPVNGESLASVFQATGRDYEIIMDKAGRAFEKFRMIPAPKRGEIVREIAEALRQKKEALGTLITLETGKIKAEGLGEVQEMIDIADFSVGLSRQLYGLTMHSERPHHRMYEQWHPLGIVGVITAFNFPAAVWSWNALIAAVCGDAILFKPSSKTPLTAIAIQNIIAPVVDKYDIDGIFNLVIGDRKDVGDPMLNDKRIPLISATGSTGMGKKVAVSVAARFGRSLLELGGNNAIIITEDANLDMALRAVLFGAVGTAGQRCTSTRRLIIHSSIKERFIRQLINAYKQIGIGDPLKQDTLMGPLIDSDAMNAMMKAVEAAVIQGGKLIYGGVPLTIEGLEKGNFVIPAIIEAENHYPIVQQETFAPIL
ncbi:MAG: aldehyde dehydrogenase family protein, partial [Desulfobacula sp.]